jgi:hypothetical protein
MNSFEEMELGLDVILEKVNEKRSDLLKLFYDFDAVKFQDFVTADDINFVISTSLEVQRALKDLRVTIEAYLDAREVYLTCLDMPNEKSLKNTPLVKKGDC